VPLQVAPEHQPVVGNRTHEQGRGDRGEHQRHHVERALASSERGEPVGEGDREQETEDHLDAQPGHPQLLEQFGQVPVVAFGLGLVGPQAPGHALLTPVIAPSRS
jgi:hypothetical protein